MKLSSWRRIVKTDFSADQQNLVEQLSIPINSAMDEIYNALNNKLTIRENISGTIAEFTVTVDSSGTPKTRVILPLQSGQTSIEGITCLNAIGTRDATLLPTSGLYINYVRDGNNVIIKNIKGLQTDKLFTVKLFIFG